MNVNLPAVTHQPAVDVLLRSMAAVQAWDRAHPPTAAPPSLVKRAARRLLGVRPLDEWYGPSVPIDVVAPQPQPVRQWDYPVAVNRNWTPRVEAPIDFWTLRHIADACTIARGAIETRKSQLDRFTWTVQPRDQDVKKKDYQRDPRIKEITARLRKPDRRHGWKQWARILGEEVFVIDAPCVYVQRDVASRVFSLDIVSGDTIKPLVDLTGRMPIDGSAAYRQVIKGVPYKDYTPADMVYYPRNPRANKLYGFSPIEQLILTVNVALRRELAQLEWFTAGTVPDAIVSTPKEWGDEATRRFDEWWQIAMGSTEDRRRMRFIPEGQVTVLKPPPLKDEFDEWLARVISWLFDLPPTWAVKMTNRNSGQVQAETATDEGTIPYMLWFADFMDQVLEIGWDAADLMFVWQDVRDQDPVKQATIHQTYINCGAMLRNEAREDLGLEPIEGGDVPTITAGHSVIRLQDVVDPPAPVVVAPGEPAASARGTGAAGAPAAGAAAAAGKDKGKGSKEGSGTREPTVAAIATAPVGFLLTTPAGDPVAAAAPRLGLAKVTAADLTRTQRQRLAGRSRNAPATRKLRRQLRDHVQAAFAVVLPQVVDQVLGHVAKAVLAHALRPTLTKAEEDDAARIARQVDAVLEALDLTGFTVLMDPAAALLIEVALRGAVQGMLTVQALAPDADQVAVPADDVRTWAAARAAELVGKRVLPDGSVIDNPDAEYAITDTTRDMLRAAIAGVFQDGTDKATFTAELEASYAFSEDRADLIARTEISNALVGGNMAGWRASGVVTGKEWVLSDLHAVADECDDNAAAGVIGIDEVFPSGDDQPGAHPKCECDLIPHVGDDTAATGGEEG